MFSSKAGFKGKAENSTGGINRLFKINKNANAVLALQWLMITDS